MKIKKTLFKEVTIYRPGDSVRLLTDNRAVCIIEHVLLRNGFVYLKLMGKTEPVKAELTVKN